MKLSLIQEATIKWTGPLHNFLGDGSDWTLNFGTGDTSRSSFLYIKAPMSLINSSIKHIAQSQLIWALPNATEGVCENIGTDKNKTKERIATIQSAYPDAEIYAYPKLTHVGESHITISMDPELRKALDNLPTIGTGLARDIKALQYLKIGKKHLFDNSGKGLTTDYLLETEEPYKVLRAGYYSDDYDPTGPMLVALNLLTDLYSDVREALNLPAKFVMNNGIAWKQHVTIGYIPQKNLINRSFVDKHGSSPRQKSKAFQDQF